MKHDPDPANDPEAEYWGYSIYDDEESDEVIAAEEYYNNWRCPHCGEKECDGECDGVYDGP
jgi:hypothetical protein